MKLLKFFAIFIVLPISSGATSAVFAQTPPESEIVVPFVLDECIKSFTSPQQAATISVRMENKAEETRQGLPLAASNVAPNATTAVAIVASDKDGRGVISFSPKRPVQGRATNNWSLEISAPFSKQDNQAVLASLAGLGGDIVASGSFSRFLWDISPADYGRAICQECARVGIRDLLLCSQFGLRQVAKQRHLDELKRQRPSDSSAPQEIRQEDLEKLDATAEELAQRESDVLDAKLQDALFGRLASKVWSLEASVGHKERTFFTPAAEKEEEHRAGHSFSAVGGLVFQSWSTYTKLTGKRDYKENDKATLCKPITGSILENCTSQPLGRAKEVESLILATEGRFFFRGFALAPSVQYDFETDVWGFEAPLFLIRNSDDRFTGGFKLAWRSDQDNLVAAVFITKPLLP